MQVFLLYFHFLHHGHELSVVPGMAEQIQDALHSLIGLKAVRGLPYDFHSVLLLRSQKKVISSGTGFKDIDSREDPFFRELSVEHP